MVEVWDKDVIPPDKLMGGLAFDCNIIRSTPEKKYGEHQSHTFELANMITYD